MNKYYRRAQVTFVNHVISCYILYNYIYIYTDNIFSLKDGSLLLPQGMNETLVETSSLRGASLCRKPWGIFFEECGDFRHLFSESDPNILAISNFCQLVGDLNVILNLNRNYFEISLRQRFVDFFTDLSVSPDLGKRIYCSSSGFRPFVVVSQALQQEPRLQLGATMLWLLA